MPISWSRPGLTKEKGNLPSAHVYLRIKDGRMTVPVCLVLRNILPELPHQGAVLSFHLPIGLRVVGRGIVRGYTKQHEDALVLYRGKVRFFVRMD